MILLKANWQINYSCSVFLILLSEFLFQGKLTKEETISQDKSRLFVIWDYVEAAGGCGSLLIVIFCILLYSSGIAFGSFWVSHWLEAGSGVRTK